MPGMTVETLAAKHGYKFANVKINGDGDRLVTLTKGERKLVIDDQLIADIQSAASPTLPPAAPKA